MSKEQSTEARRPWHLWLVGVLSVLWNSIACLDFTMVQTRNASYLKGVGFSAEQMEFFYSYPSWAVAIWGIAVWSAILGGALLLAMQSLAAPAFLIGLIAYLAAMLRQYGSTEFTSLFPEAQYPIMSAVIFALAVAQLYYAHKMKDKGVLS